MSSTTAESPRWGSVAEAAAEHGVGASSVRRWIGEGRIRAERVGPRRFRVDLDSLTEETSPGLPTPTQLVAALAALDDGDVEAIRRVAEKIYPATDGSALVFAHIWQAIGSVARVQAKAAARA
ncbi:excisionase family DNA-binding protein [Microbacterium testaceum]|uniref:excisionase family DNA-binding protein n=1 Tax=Microbacterium testaceum TaxID=2033 RepID=UPI00343CAF0C